MIAKRNILCGLVLTILLPGLDLPVFSADNLIRNGGMELGEGNPANWGMWGWQMKNARFSLDSGNAYQGKRYATIENSENNDARFIQEVLVEKGNIYKISGWIQTFNVGRSEGVKGASICLLENSRYSTRDIKGSNGKWEYVEFYLEVGEYVMKVTVSLAVGGTRKLNTGRASFDEVSMVAVDTVPEGAIYSKIEGTPENIPQTPPPTSKNTALPPSPASSPGTPEASSGNPVLIIITILMLSVLAIVIILFIAPGRNKKESTEEDE